jgi:hypothetical protein
MLMAFSVDDNETLRRISGGDLALFAQSTRDFLRAASAPEARMALVVAAKEPARVASVSDRVPEKKD